MYKIIATFAAALIVYGANCQVSMSVQVPPSGIILKDQLWTMVLSNTGSSTQVALNLTLTDVTSNESVLTASTAPFTLNNGSLQLQAGDLSITYSYLSSVVVDREPNGFLPLGNFETCYELTIYGHIGSMPNDCINIMVEPISPPLLNMPMDGSTNESAYPQFNWLPPTPLEMFSYLTYDLVLVEVQQGQLPAEAIQQNIPILMDGSNENIFSNYPSSFAPLDTTKLYAWQVIAKNNNQYAAQSEIWTFKVRGDSAVVQFIDKDAYIKLQRQLNASVSTVKGILKFHYKNDADDSTVSYQVTSLEAADLGMVVKEGSLQTGFGENFLSIALSGDSRLIEDRYYLLELFNSRNEKWAMKFLYKKPEEINIEEDSQAILQ